MVDECLITHCSPTLAFLKSANLCSLRFHDEKELLRQVDYWNEELKGKGISIMIMQKKPEWALLYVCRKKYLQKTLRKKDVAEFLYGYGYEDLNVDAALDTLKYRLNETGSFPHEIGVFLDYPLGDVKGFIDNKGCNFKCQGCWKVYCNERETVKLFQKYNKCREVYLRLWNAGKSIQKLTVAV